MLLLSALALTSASAAVSASSSEPRRFVPDLARLDSWKRDVNTEAWVLARDELTAI